MNKLTNIWLALALALALADVNAQDSVQVAAEESSPVIEYTLQRKVYEIAGISVTGADAYEDFVLIGFSGLAVGDKIEVPGTAGYTVLPTQVMSEI